MASTPVQQLTGEQQRLNERGTTKDQVIADLLRILGHCEGDTISARLDDAAQALEVGRSTVGNTLNGHNPIGPKLLEGMYGTTGCTLPVAWIGEPADWGPITPPGADDADTPDEPAAEPNPDLAVNDALPTAAATEQHSRHSDASPPASGPEAARDPLPPTVAAALHRPEPADVQGEATAGEAAAGRVPPPPHIHPASIPAQILRATDRARRIAAAVDVIERETADASALLARLHNLRAGLLELVA
ncbi:hypothetical protein GCM10007973_18140 [Polymorphobacter multimanifer]|uniref:Uncharacterized protein n=1 Tax=Polymorphobacter multimanifer TaxID=1070431 RepID=A0A841LH88_9SPHN|nr:hypothetical protein [Polymorphobacter multimanifer]MBB6228328.1 hypothetical protein [Polymorphobacter multimanifer]GGI82086.1 hypothetical protein GCM10007973_18140 [Polymorphobacter multimanifer]